MILNQWQARELGDCVRLLSGGTPSKSNPAYWGGNVPWVSSKDMKVSRLFDAEDHLTEEGSRNGTRLVPPGTVLIAVRGMILAKHFPVAMAMRQVAFNQDLKAVQCGHGVDAAFMFYWFQANAYEILGIADEAGHGTKRLQTDRLLKLPLHLPPLPVQQQIVAILSAYDDLIENNTRRIAILEAMAQALYREWFVHFRFPGHDQSGAEGAGRDGAPASWEVRNLFDVAEVTYGFPFQSKRFTDKPVGKPVIRIRDINNRKTNTFTDEVAANKYLVQNGDLVVGMDGDFHMGMWAGGEAYLNQRVVRFRPKHGLSACYLQLALEAPIEHFNSTIVGTTVAHLSDRDLRTVDLLVPDNRMRAMTSEVLDPLRDLQLALHLKNTNLRRTRDLLLPKLLSGEINVSSLDIDIGEASDA